MATNHSISGLIKKDAVTIAEFVNGTLTVSANLAPDHAGADAWDSFLVGRKNWSVDLTMRYDPTEATGQGTLFAGEVLTLHFQPEGDVSGDEDYNGSVIIETEGIEIPDDGAVMKTITARGNGALTRGTIV